MCGWKDGWWDSKKMTDWSVGGGAGGGGAAGASRD